MLALICGTGRLPAAVAHAQDVRPIVCVLEGFAPDALDADIGFRLEKLGSFLEGLKARGVTEVCLCGAITRPVIDPALLDAQTLPLVPILLAAMASGDDGALRAVLGIFETGGFVIRGAHELAPNLLPDAGVLTVAQPDETVRRGMEAAKLALAEMGTADLGQACLVKDGVVMAREDTRGTDALIAHAFETGNAAGGFLFKGAKPKQDRRADLPTIGHGTAQAVIAAGLAGIVVQAGAVMMLDRAELVADLDTAGLFLLVADI